MLLVDSGMGLVQHIPLNHQGTHLLYWKLPPTVLRIFENLLILLIVFDLIVFDGFCCYVCGSDPTLGTNIMSLESLLAATARHKHKEDTAIIIFHTDLLSLSQEFFKQVNNINSSNSHTGYHTIKCTQRQF